MDWHSKRLVTRDKYDATAYSYDEVYKAEQYMKYMVALSKIPPHGTVLDAGCGTGLLVEYLYGLHILQNKVSRYVCLDLSRGMLEHAVQRLAKLPECHGKCHVIEGDVENLPFPDNRFDIVYSFTVLDLVDNPYRAADELRRVSRGPVIVSMLKKLHVKDLFVHKARYIGSTPADVILDIQ